MTDDGKPLTSPEQLLMAKEAFEELKKWGGSRSVSHREGMSTSINPFEGTFSLQFARAPDWTVSLEDGLEVCTAMMRAYLRNLDGVVVRQGSGDLATLLREGRPMRDRPRFLMEVHWSTGGTLDARISVPRDRFYQIALLAADLRHQIVKSVMES